MSVRASATAAGASASGIESADAPASAVESEMESAAQRVAAVRHSLAQKLRSGVVALAAEDSGAHPLVELLAKEPPDGRALAPLQILG